MPASQAEFRPDLHLRRNDLSFTPMGLTVTVRWSKTNQFKSRTRVIPLPRIRGHALCPTQAVFNALCQTGGVPGDGPALVYPTAGGFSPLTPAQFLGILRRALAPYHDVVSRFAGHSFRRGGAMWGLSKGLNVEILRQLGDWKSSAYTAYVIADSDKLREATTAMAAGLQ